MGKGSREKDVAAKVNEKKGEAIASEVMGKEENAPELRKYLEDIVASKNPSRYQRQYLRYYQELADSMHRTLQGLSLKKRWRWLMRFKRNPMERWEDGEDIHFERSSMSK